MKNKILIGLGLVAVAGGIYYLYNKNKTDKASDAVKTDEKKSGMVYLGGGTNTPRYTYRRRLANGTIIQ